LAIFKSFQAFHRFAHSVRVERRYILSPDSLMFLEDVKQAAKTRVKTLPKGFHLWRAQTGSESHDLEIWKDIVHVSPLPAKRMLPDPKLVGDGRLNPRGIAYLYLAEDELTAIAEVRPWLSADVSVAKFELLRDCKILDCTGPTDRSSLYGMTLVSDPTGKESAKLIPPPESDWDEVVWSSISQAFAEPTDPQDSTLTYAPTQIIAEVLRNDGYDGIRYQSSMLKEGVNVALFDVQSAKGSEPELKRVTSIKYKYSRGGTVRFAGVPTPGEFFKEVERAAPPTEPTA